MMVTVPCLLLLLDYWPLRRFPLAGNPVANPATLGKLLLEKVPYVALSISVAIVTVIGQLLVNPVFHCGAGGFARWLPDWRPQLMAGYVGEI